MKEIWKPIPQNKNYEVSTLGRVRNKLRGHFLTVFVPLLRIQLPNSTFIYLPKLMDEVFGIKGDGKLIAHLNGNRSDNRLSNLRYVTRRDFKLYYTNRDTPDFQVKYTIKIIKQMKKMAKSVGKRKTASYFNLHPNYLALLLNKIVV